MSGSAPAWILAVLVTLALSRSTWTASINEDDHGVISNISDEDDDRVESLESRPKNVSDDFDEMLTSLDIERRRAKNFRGDLGKRSRGNSRLRPDLGKRSTSTGRTNGGRPKFRPDLGKRVTGDELYFRSLPDFRSSSVDEQLNDSDERQSIRDDLAEEMELGQGPPETKRARGSSFRGDLGKRLAGVKDDIEDSLLVDLDNAVAGVDGEPSKRAKSSFRGDLGKRLVDAFNEGLSATSFAAIDKRPRFSSSSRLRGDLGKRRSSPEGHNLQGEELSLAKRPRSQSLRGDLG